jgi:hypothetical protein
MRSVSSSLADRAGRARAQAVRPGVGNVRTIDIETAKPKT